GFLKTSTCPLSKRAINELEVPRSMPKSMVDVMLGLRLCLRFHNHNPLLNNCRKTQVAMSYDWLNDLNYNQVVCATTSYLGFKIRSSFLEGLPHRIFIEHFFSCEFCFDAIHISLDIRRITVQMQLSLNFVKVVEYTQNPL